ncbi:MAG TPA: hypothetical protein PLW88_05455 [Syntrophorhabdaceae bacterium]|nr:hypothetical protein [Syntrophorhabdaceae bacterium]
MHSQKQRTNIINKTYAETYRVLKTGLKIKAVSYALGLMDMVFWQEKSVFTKMERSNPQPLDKA